MTTGLYRQVLIATLGTHPQVVTLAADMLADDQGVVVDEVLVIHTAPEGPVGEALERLRDEFDRNQYRGRRCVYQEVPMATRRGEPVRDIRTEKDAECAFNTIYRTVKSQKRAGKRVHLSIAGGRNSMVVYGAATAQILFDLDDRLWHVLSKAEFERSGLMHRQSHRDATLAPVPVLCWSSVSPALTALVREEDPFRAVALQQERLAEEETDRRREEFLKEVLTPEQWRVLGNYVTHGGTNRQIALRLDRSVRTVEKHLEEIYGEMRSFFGYKPDIVGRDTVMQQFATFLKRHPQLRSPPED